MQPQTFVFFGIVGSGKGTQSKLLQEFLKNKNDNECVYAATGEGFRALLNVGNYTSALLKNKMEKGELIDDFFANSIIANILSQQTSPEKHIVFDGYPRTVAQSEVFEQMAKFFNRGNVKIIFIDVSREEVLRRSLKRNRHDDTEEGLRKRIDIYFKDVIPSMQYFENRDGYEICKINGEQSKEDVFKDIINKLGYSF